MRLVADLVLITSSALLQFYESPERPADRRSVRIAIDHLLRLLLPYHTDERKKEVLDHLRGNH
jgi:hypothetical protein